MNSAPPHSKIVERIRKLLKLAGNNPNAHEAQAAKAKAEALMKENRISEADVQEPMPPDSDPFRHWYRAPSGHDSRFYTSYYKWTPNTDKDWTEFRHQAEETYKQQQTETARKTAAAADDAQLKACRQMIADIEKQKASLKSVWTYLNGQLKATREAHDKRYKEL